jgi:CDGSH-type Zn-finger protein/uncharacterized Fe-S cluster protein YjdI
MSRRHQRTYGTEAIRIHRDSSRCTHTGICLRTLPSVFDLRRRPWVELRAAVADAVARCPTGALRYKRLDGALREEPQRPTAVWPITDGPLLVAGDLDVRAPDEEPLTHGTRLTSCRCGLSHNQPFCDNSHRRRKWKSGPSTDPQRLSHSDGREMVDAGQALLCRCGQSANKPSCDSSHAPAGFRSRPAVTPRDRLEADTPAAFAANPRVPDARPNTRGG